MTLLYAHYTGSTVAEVARQKEEKRTSGRSLPQPPNSVLPWKMEELPGTTWRNTYTYRATTVQQLEKNREGKLGPDPDEWINAMFSLGLWRGDCFCIEHWVRVDHLPAQIQVDWATERVAYCRQELLYTQKHPSNSATFHKQNVESKQRDLHRARQQLTSLASKLSVTLTTNPANIGIQPNEQFALL